MDRIPERKLRYWVKPGELLAGPYPSDFFGGGTQQILLDILNAGIRSFIDLTMPIQPYGYHYADELAILGQAKNLDLFTARMPIEDFGIPDQAFMKEILNLVDARISAGSPVYIHCRGGLGRTGTVVCCWLIRHGCPVDEVFSRLDNLRKDTYTADEPSPETEEQMQFVFNWKEGM